MSKYLRLSPSRKGEIECLLGPIFDKVRSKKLYSYHQLQQNFTQRQTTTLGDLKPNNTLEVSEQKQQTGIKFVQIKPRSNSLKLQLPYPLTNGTYPRKSPTKQLDKTVGQMRVFREKPKKLSFIGGGHSTIKKHLVQRIDMQQVEKSFYKKRQALTRYDYFMWLKSKKHETRMNFILPRSKSKLSNSQIQKPYQIQSPINNPQKSMECLSNRNPTCRKFYVRSTERRTINLEQYKMSSISPGLCKTIAHQ